MSLRVPTLLLAAALGAASSLSPARGETPPPPAPPVGELVAAALADSPALAALRARLAAAREMEAPAGALPDPMVEAMLQNDGFDRWAVGEMETSMVALQVRQGFPYPGKRAASREVARAETAQRAAELAALERQIAAEVRTLYARLYALDRERQALGAARELVDMLSATAASRYAAGEAEQEALLKAQLEISRLAEELDDLAAERAAMVAELNRWLDRTGGEPLGDVAALPEPSPPPAPPWEVAAAEAAPEVTVGRAGIAAAEKRLAVARLELKPNLAASGGVGLRGSLDPMLLLGVGVELPFWRRHKQLPMVRAAEEELRMAQAELRDAQAMARAEAARLQAEWRNANEQIVRYREAIVPQTSAALDAARASYLAGRGDFSTVVEDFDLWLDTRVGLARREAQRFVAWAELERLLTSKEASREEAH